ncbi:MAG: hypothetical protein Q4B67_08610 [Eubacteriales bacterium]|nr:hypothetical protein [Eubacteriales bacterium]
MHRLRASLSVEGALVMITVLTSIGIIFVNAMKLSDRVTINSVNTEGSEFKRHGFDTEILERELDLLICTENPGLSIPESLPIRPEAVLRARSLIDGLGGEGESNDKESP